MWCFNYDSYFRSSYFSCVSYLIMSSNCIVFLIPYLSLLFIVFYIFITFYFWFFLGSRPKAHWAFFFSAQPKPNTGLPNLQRPIGLRGPKSGPKLACLSPHLVKTGPSLDIPSPHQHHHAFALETIPLHPVSPLPISTKLMHGHLLCKSLTGRLRDRKSVV